MENSIEVSNSDNEFPVLFIEEQEIQQLEENLENSEEDQNLLNENLLQSINKVILNQNRKKLN